MREFQEYCGPGLPHPKNRLEYPPSDMVDVTSLPSLDAIASVILDEISKKNHAIGFSDYDDSEYDDNYYYHEKDGWRVELAYRLCGKWCIDTGDYWTPPSTDLTKVWGDIMELTVSYDNDETGENHEFDEEELKNLRTQIYNAIIDSIPVF